MKIRTVEANKGATEDFISQMREIQAAAKTTPQNADDAPLASKRLTLGNLLKRVEIMQSALYTGKSWNYLMKAYSRAKNAFSSNSVDVHALSRIINELTAALGKLEQAQENAEDDEIREKLPVVLDSSQNGADAIQTPAAANPGEYDVQM